MYRLLYYTRTRTLSIIQYTVLHTQLFTVECTLVLVYIQYVNVTIHQSLLKCVLPSLHSESATVRRQAAIALRTVCEHVAASASTRTRSRPRSSLHYLQWTLSVLVGAKRSASFAPPVPRLASEPLARHMSCVFVLDEQ